MSPEELALITDLHVDGRRQGPGSDADTLLALALCRLENHRRLRVADIGCGTGASTLVLATELNAHITAIDFAQPFLDRLTDRAEAHGFSDRIAPVCATMEDPPIEPYSLDLIWSEGAVYNMGFDAGLKAWRNFIKPGGLVAVSEITWLSDNRPRSLTEYWEQAYPKITTATGNITKLERAGFELMGYFSLPESSWMDEYYTPLLVRMDDFLDRHQNSALAHSIRDAEQSEIELYRNNREHFSYGFYIARAQ